jgi:FlgD Ig-like domain
MGEFINRFRFFGNPVTLGYASGNTVYRYSETPLPVSRQVAAALETRLFDSAEPAESSRPIRIPLAVPAEVSRLSINVWDRFGDHVRQLTDEMDPSPGSRIAEWDVTDHTGAPLEPGYYIVRVTADDRSESKILWITD